MFPANNLLDIWINSKIVLLQHPAFTKIMVFITNIASPTNLLILSIIFLGFLIYKKRWYFSLLLVFGMAGGFLLKTLLKLLIQRARPENALIIDAGYSFPSGHATLAVIFFTLTIYIFKDDIKNRMLKYIFIFADIIIILLVGFSRIYLNVHWFSDVIAGFALGLFWLTLLVLTFKVINSFVKERLDALKNRLENFFFKTN